MKWIEMDWMKKFKSFQFLTLLKIVVLKKSSSAILSKRSNFVISP